MGWLIYCLPLLGGVAMAIWLPPLADWASRRGTSLGFVLLFTAELRFWIVVPLVIVCWVLLVRLTKRSAFGLPSGIRTVADLVPFVVTSAQMSWTRGQIEQQVRDIVLTRLPVPPERYQAAGRFREDFGLEAGLEKL